MIAKPRPRNPSQCRLFFALWPGDATRAQLLRLQAAVQGRHTPVHSLHLTLAFLGLQPVDALPTLYEVLAALPAHKMGLRIDRLGYFSKPQIAWAGMQAPPPDLMALQAELVRALGEQGIAVDAHAGFTPHITLARNANAPGPATFAPIEWEAGELVLLESDAGGYQVRAARRLAGCA